ncbi:F-box/LRR-repeat protein 17-like isoform X2 [Salvelinus namaycush]|uniref:F-box/LRR-repeat protein 17-like isoform X2 n=1 Tax=Salvelinus namaycush TaxID=8040 RepID=A0A8U0U976_SALNM|nr:F-box/LRR-repeat protein 17-like isoform X2 [Salvelinus namaycush]
MKTLRVIRSFPLISLSLPPRCVEIIAKEGRSLKELYLVSCKITDHALIAIGQYSSTIETVDAGWCKEITDQGATQIARSSKSLRYLGLMRCDKCPDARVRHQQGGFWPGWFAVNILHPCGLLSPPRPAHCQPGSA